MRTGILFLERAESPTEEDQYQAYRAMAAAMGDRPLVIRALDIGGDKQVSYLDLPREENLPRRAARGCRCAGRNCSCRSCARCTARRATAPGSR